jgi:hypothetical protein
MAKVFDDSNIQLSRYSNARLSNAMTQYPRIPETYENHFPALCRSRDTNGTGYASDVATGNIGVVMWQQGRRDEKGYRILLVWNTAHGFTKESRS